MTSLLKPILLTLTGLLILTVSSGCRTTGTFRPSSDGVLTIVTSGTVYFPAKSVMFPDGKGGQVMNPDGFYADRDWRLAPPRK